MTPTGPGEQTLLARLSQVYWIGGSPCSGKSSIADILAARHGFTVYHCDDHYTDHLELANPEVHPAISWVKGKTWNEIWSRTVDRAVRDELEFYREEFGMIVDDLLALPGDRPILAEGASLLPECVATVLREPRHAAWVVPTPEFQLHHYSRRTWLDGVLAECDDPVTAFDTWMGRDIEFARRVSGDAASRGLEVVIVDGTKGIDEVAALVEARFGLARGGRS